MVRSNKKVSLAIILAQLAGCQAGGVSQYDKTSTMGTVNISVGLSEAKSSGAPIYGYPIKYDINCSEEWKFAGYIFPSDCENERCTSLFENFNAGNIYSFYAQTVDINYNESLPSEIITVNILQDGKSVNYDCSRDYSTSDF